MLQTHPLPRSAAAGPDDLPKEVQPLVSRTRCAQIRAGRADQTVVDLGYEEYRNILSKRSLDNLEGDLYYTFRFNVENACVSVSYVKAFFDVLSAKRTADAALPSYKKHYSHDTPTLYFDDSPWNDVVVRHVPFGPKGQTIRVEVPRALDAGD